MPSTIVTRLAAGAAAIALAVGANSATAQEDVAQFYRGKTVAIVIGSAPGGGFDTYGRIVARHLGRFIPGAPNVIPQNMPGAGGIAAGRFVANTAAQDGLFIGAIHPATIMSPILGSDPKAKERINMQFLGSANSDVEVCIARSDAPVKTFADMLTTEVIVGAASDVASTREFATLLKSVLDARFKIVAGYTGNREIFLAMQRGEVQAACGVSYSGFSSTQATWIKSGEVKILAQEDVKGHPELNKRGIPLTTSVTKTAEDKEVLELFYSQMVFGRPYAVGPGVPADRVAALRKAFLAMLADKEFLADADKINLEITALSGDELQAIVDKIYATPPEVVERTKKALGYSG
jgi:tripartite-type tricarboxylate transporter receptor subunit TctC